VDVLRQMAERHAQCCRRSLQLGSESCRDQ
jgi:hypothetical protein